MSKATRRPRNTALDGRSWEYKLLVRTKAELTAHVGGKPSITQKALIERAAWLTVYVAKMDARTAAARTMSEHDTHVYLAWSNSLARTMARIGMTGAAQRVPSLRDHIASRQAAA